MNDFELNKSLALTIGWKEVDMRKTCGSLLITTAPGVWRVFDYMDWRVIGPVAARYNLFPQQFRRHGEVCWNTAVDTLPWLPQPPTPQRTIAEDVVRLHLLNTLKNRRIV